MNDRFSPKTIRVPVKLVDGKWEYFYGGQLAVKEGALADLVLLEGSVTDKEFVRKIARKSQHKILERGTELLVALTIKREHDLGEGLKKYLIEIPYSEIVPSTPFKNNLLSPDTLFVKITIAEPTDKQQRLLPKETGGVWLDMQGLQPKGLSSSSIALPDGVADEKAISLNHAFTLLSSKYEPWRKSHTGNIYSRMFYKEKNKRWYPLDVLRNAAIAKDEHKLIKEQWAEISERLNLGSLNK